MMNTIVMICHSWGRLTEDANTQNHSLGVLGNAKGQGLGCEGGGGGGSLCGSFISSPAIGLGLAAARGR